MYCQTLCVWQRQILADGEPLLIEFVACMHVVQTACIIQCIINKVGNKWIFNQPLIFFWFITGECLLDCFYLFGSCAKQRFLFYLSFFPLPSVINSANFLQDLKNVFIQYSTWVSSHSQEPHNCHQESYRQTNTNTTQRKTCDTAFRLSAACLNYLVKSCPEGQWTW